MDSYQDKTQPLPAMPPGLTGPRPLPPTRPYPPALPGTSAPGGSGGGVEPVAGGSIGAEGPSPQVVEIDCRHKREKARNTLESDIEALHDEMNARRKFEPSRKPALDQEEARRHSLLEEKWRLELAGIDADCQRESLAAQGAIERAASARKKEITDLLENRKRVEQEQRQQQDEIDTARAEEGRASILAHRDDALRVEGMLRAGEGDSLPPGASYGDVSHRFQAQRKGTRERAWTDAPAESAGVRDVVARLGADGDAPRPVDAESLARWTAIRRRTRALLQQHPDDPQLREVLRVAEDAIENLGESAPSKP